MLGPVHRVGFTALVLVVLMLGIAWLTVERRGGDVAAAQTKASVRAEREYRATVRLYRARGRWARSVNGICHRLDRRTKKLYDGADTRDEIVVALHANLRLIDRALVDLRAVKPVPRDRARVRRMLALYGRAVPPATEMVAAFERSDVPSIRRAISRIDKPARRADRIASSLGAQACVNGSGLYVDDEAS
jgi:hypothetical protein